MELEEGVLGSAIEEGTVRRVEKENLAEEPETGRSSSKEREEREELQESKEEVRRSF